MVEKITKTFFYLEEIRQRMAQLQLLNVSANCCSYKDSKKRKAIKLGEQLVNRN